MVGIIKGNLKEAAEYGAKKGIVIVYGSSADADDANRLKDYLSRKGFAVTVTSGELRVFEMEPRWYIFVGRPDTNINIQKFSIAFRLIGYPHVWLIGDKICIVPKPESKVVYCNPEDYMIVTHPFEVPKGLCYITMVCGLSDSSVAIATDKTIAILEAVFPWKLILGIVFVILLLVIAFKAISRRRAAAATV